MPMSAPTTRPQNEVRSLETRHVFLDTQVYRLGWHNPENALLAALAEQIEEHRLVLHVTDITLAEIKRQLTGAVDEAAQEMQRAEKAIARWRRRHPDLVAGPATAIDVTAVSDAAFLRLRSAMRGWRAVEHSASTEGAQAIFQDYFVRRPPFCKPSSKEFPDAFVIKSLDSWCREQDERMYVVTGDGAMREAAEASDQLIPVRKLEEVLSAAAAGVEPDIIRVADSLLADDDVVENIQAELDAKILDVTTYYVGDMAEGETTDHELAGDIAISAYAVIAATAESISVLMDIVAPLNVTVSYHDRSEALYDNEDDVFVGAEYADATFETDVTIRAVARLASVTKQIRDFEILTGEVKVTEPYETYK